GRSHEQILCLDSCSFALHLKFAALRAAESAAGSIEDSGPDHYGTKRTRLARHHAFTQANPRKHQKVRSSRCRRISWRWTGNSRELRLGNCELLQPRREGSLGRTRTKGIGRLRPFRKRTRRVSHLIRRVRWLDGV